MENCVEILGIANSGIRVFKDGDEIFILHRNTDSLLKFSLPDMPLTSEIAGAVNLALFGLDFDQNFDIVFTKQEYRKAVLRIPSILMGE